MNPENFDQPTFAEILQGYEAEVARLTSELAAARVNEARYLWLRDAEWPRNVASVVTLQKNAVWDEVIDAARRAGGEG